jgi:GntR family transcriptional regulator
MSEGDASAHIALLLDLPDGALVVIRNRRCLLDNKPVLLSKSYLPATLVAGSAITQPDTKAAAKP